MFDARHFSHLGAIGRVERTERGFVADTGTERLRVDVIRGDTLRLALSKNGAFDDAPSFATAFAMPPPVPFRVEETPERIELVCERLRLVVGKRDLALDAYRADGSVVFESARDAEGRSLGYRELNDEFLVTRRAGQIDLIYGLGQRTGGFNRRGRRFILWNLDVLDPHALETNRLFEADPSQKGDSTAFDPYYTSIPFFYHGRREGERLALAGFFVDNGYKAHFDFSGEEALAYHFLGGHYTEYVFAGPDIRSILEAYTFVTGRPALPPLWSLGYHHCRWHEYTAEDLLQIAREYRRRDIPCDALWLDIDHMDGFRVFTWHAERFPDPPRLFAELEADGFRAVTIVDPGVKFEPGFPLFDAGNRDNLFCKTESGKLYEGAVWPGRTVFPDFVKPEARAFWANLVRDHASKGVAGIWNDMNEPATGAVDPFAMRFDHDGRDFPHERYHNQYALLMAMATRDGLLGARPSERPFILSRAGFAGIQRYAAQWLGDNQSSWEHLAMSLPMAAGMGVSGQPFIGADIPGFAADADAELAARWWEHGALTPFCRGHNQKGRREQYPWSFGPEVEAMARQALRLRYRLLPYLYSAFVRASETGEPVQRPLVFDFQDDPIAAEIDDQYLFGPALLVAPVLTPGQLERQVYLPRGTWVDWHDDRVYAGPGFVTVAAPLGRIPIFARGGAVVPLYEEAPPSTRGYFPRTLELHVFVPAEDGESVSWLREDDGISLQRDHGDFLDTEFLLARRGGELTLSSRVTGRGFPEFRRERSRVVVRSFPVRSASCDGKTIPPSNDSLVLEDRGEPFEIVVGI